MTSPEHPSPPIDPALVDAMVSPDAAASSEPQAELDYALRFVDTELFEAALELRERVVRWVVGKGPSYLISYDVAEDIVQAAYLRLWEQYGPETPEAERRPLKVFPDRPPIVGVKNLLHTIADYGRLTRISYQRRPVASIDEMEFFEPPTPEYENPASKAGLTDTQARLLHALDVSERVTMELLIEGYKPKEIAAILVRSERTVWSHMSRARAKLRAVLNDNPDLLPD